MALGNLAVPPIPLEMIPRWAKALIGTFRVLALIRAATILNLALIHINAL